MQMGKRGGICSAVAFIKMKQAYMLVAGFCVGSTSGMAVKEIEINFVHD